VMFSGGHAGHINRTMIARTAVNALFQALFFVIQD
jgi:hypothetical protein